MSDPRTPRNFIECHRFGRVGRIPRPTPFPAGDINSYLVFPGFVALEPEGGVERARAVEHPA